MYERFNTPEKCRTAEHSELDGFKKMSSPKTDTAWKGTLLGVKNHHDLKSLTSVPNKSNKKKKPIVKYVYIQDVCYIFIRYKFIITMKGPNIRDFNS